MCRKEKDEMQMMSMTKGENQNLPTDPTLRQSGDINERDCFLNVMAYSLISCSLLWAFHQPVYLVAFVHLHLHLAYAFIHSVLL